jgi:hypothetical protein
MKDSLCVRELNSTAINTDNGAAKETDINKVRERVRDLQISMVVMVGAVKSIFSFPCVPTTNHQTPKMLLT